MWVERKKGRGVGGGEVAAVLKARPRSRIVGARQRGPRPRFLFCF
jgi:hypothetical protein